MSRPGNNESVSGGSGKPFLNSDEVVERLGVSKSTLYAYVSRGLIRSEPDPDSPRAKRYRADDVERLINRQRARANPELASSEALAWGSPVLESSVSTIVDERLYYRSADAIDLSAKRSFEEIVALLWLGDLEAELPGPGEEATNARRSVARATQELAGSLDVAARAQMMFPALEQQEPASYDFRPETIYRIGFDAIQTFVFAMVGSEARSGIARTLQAYWSPGQTASEALLDAALILSADHELNASTFTVRCIASTKAPLLSTLSGGLSALRGHKHGGATLQTDAQFREVIAADSAYDALRDRLKRGESLAGFGHRLYPSGDPRGQQLLKLLHDAMPAAPATKLAGEICEAAEALQGLKPNLEFGLVALCRALELPAGTALSLMALGRLAGWIAHAQEEYERDQLIRPRARQDVAEQAAE